MYERSIAAINEMSLSKRLYEFNGELVTAIVPTEPNRGPLVGSSDCDPFQSLVDVHVVVTVTVLHAQDQLLAIP